MKNYILLTIFCLGLATTSYSQKVKVKFLSASLVYNNSVGNEWGYSAEVNGTNIYRNKVKELTVEESFKLDCSATERDKYSDYGSNDRRIYLTDIPSDEPKIYTVDVIVKEDRGRYAGNTAKWKFTFEVSK